MGDLAVRKSVTVVEAIRHDGGPIPETPRRRGAVLCVVSNPYAGGYVENVAAGVKALEPLGLEMSDRLVAALGGIGALHQGVYACASFWAVDDGLTPALMTLLGTLQPPLTAVIAARLFGERASARVAIGLALGVPGTAIAVWPESGPGPVGLPVVALALTSVFAITAGTLLQKGSAGEIEFVPSSFLQDVRAARPGEAPLAR